MHVAPTDGDISELRQSYSDVGNDAGKPHERSLCYFSDALFTGAELIAALQDAIRGVYHKFDPAVTVSLLVREYDDVALFQPAREVTVTIYVHSKNSKPLPMPSSEIAELLKVDELDYVNASNTILRLRWN